MAVGLPAIRPEAVYQDDVLDVGLDPIEDVGRERATEVHVEPVADRRGDVGETVVLVRRERVAVPAVGVAEGGLDRVA